MHDWDSQIAQAVTETNQGQIVIKINPVFASDVVGRTKPYKNFPSQARPALQAVGDYVRVEMIPRTFAREGPGWRRLSRRSQRERAAQGYNPKHPILIRTRDLFKELTDKSHPKHVEIIRTGKNARIIIGGSSDKFIKNQLGSPVERIPARPMIPGTGTTPLGARDRNAIRDILEKEIRKALMKNG